ncbi:MAG TPA: hypothetical protein VNG53_00890 [Bacteroidia bacterium]|nr:hypothetical protein [Bacteroidia bacterium]
METIHLSANYHQVEVANSNKSLLSKLISRLKISDKELQINHYGIIAFALIAQVCVGSIACMLLLENDLNNVWFGACVISTMAVLVTVLSQMPTRWVLRALFGALLVNIFIILFCLL